MNQPTALVIAALLSVASLSACGQATAPALQQVSSVKAVAACAVSVEGGYRLLQAVSSWKRADVTKVVLQLLKLEGGQYVATGQTMTLTNLDQTVVLSGLQFSTSYRIEAIAYATIDGVDVVISKNGRTPTDFGTPALADGANPVVTIAGGIKVELFNKTVASQTNAMGLGVTPGSLVEVATPVFLSPSAAQPYFPAGDDGAWAIASNQGGVKTMRLRNPNPFALPYRVVDGSDQVVASGTLAANEEKFLAFTGNPTLRVQVGTTFDVVSAAK